MDKSREEMIARAVEIIKKENDCETEVDKLFAHALQAGYDLGKLAQEQKSA